MPSLNFVKEYLWCFKQQCDLPSVGEATMLIALATKT